MKYNKIVITAILTIFLFCIAGAYASDTGGDAVAGEDMGIELTTTENNVKTIENEQTINETDNKGILSVNNDENVVAENDLNVLGYSCSTFTGLSEEIGSGGNIELAHDYYIYSGHPGTISITVPGVIDGKGAIIDMKGTNIQAFSVKVDGVTFKNLTIINALFGQYAAGILFEKSGTLINCNFINNKAENSYGGAVTISGYGNVTNCNFDNCLSINGGAIYFTSSGTVENCNFTNNYASREGGAVYFGSSSIVENCNFTNNKANRYYGGAIRMDSGSINNCNFNNHSSRLGGAIMFYHMGNVTNCNFDKAISENDGGAIYFWGGGNVINCNFTNTLASRYGGAVDIQGNGKVENCNFVKSTANGDSSFGGSIYFASAGSLTNCNFTDSNAYQGGAVFFQIAANVANCNFNNASASGDGGAIYFKKNGGLVNCNFTNNKVTNGHGGAVYIYGTGDVSDCNFINNYLNQKATAQYANGGAIYMISGNVVNSNFINNKATATKSSGGAVYISTTGNVVNCNFTNNAASSQGSAVYIDFDGSVKNSNFVENIASGDSGTVYFSNYGGVENCNFTNNVANKGNGSAIRIYSGSVENCNFNNNEAYSGTVYFDQFGDVKNCNFTDNYATYYGGAVRVNTGSVEYCGFTNNYASVGGAVYILSGFVRDCNFTDNEASDVGGAVYILSGPVRNCNFTDNEASDVGGAVWISSGSVENCNFNNNTAFSGTLYINKKSNITNCNFVNNHVSENGGAICFNELNNIFTVKNCNFIGNKARTGGAVYIYLGTFENCNFVNNTASVDGGAVYFNMDGNVADCNFTNNQATDFKSFGGAIYFQTTGNIANCNFVDNNAPGFDSWGGAVFFSEDGSVSNCNFTNNHGGYGGAIWFFQKATVTNCYFANNTGLYAGGAVLFRKHVDLSNSNFVDNAVYSEPSNRNYGGGAIQCSGSADITDCNFTGNRAPVGSAIYFFSTSNDKSVSNSIFLDNRADSHSTPFKIVRNGDRVEITYNGRDNLLNGIYSANDPLAPRDSEVRFTNVTYWGANGIANTGENTIVIPRSFNEAGQNITAIVFVNNIFISNTTKVTNEKGTIVLDIVAGNYKVTARHDADLYYTRAEKSQTFKVAGNESSLKLNASGYIIKAALTPNIGNTDILFVVKDESGVVKTVESPVNDEGIAELNVTGLSEGEYEIVATYRGNNEYYPCQSSMTYELIKLDSKVLIEAANITTDKAEIINITVNNATDKHVVIYFNKEKYYADNGTFILTGLDEGIYSVMAVWGGDDYYRVGSNSTIFWVIRNLEYYVNVTAMTYIGKTANITAKSNIPNNILQGELIFTLPNGTEISANYNDDRTWWAICTFDDYGDYYITASYSGLDGVTINNATINFKNPITISDMSSFYGDVANVVAEVHESFEGQNVTISVNKTSKNATVKNAKAEANFTDLAVGEYVIAVNYAGGTYDPAYASAKLTVNKINSTLEVNDTSLDYGKSAIIIATTEGTIGIAAKIGDTNVSVINNVILIPNGLEIGNHILTVTTIPDENHFGVTKTAAITILPVKQNTLIDLNVSIVENYVTFTVSVNSDATGVVRFELSGTEERPVYTDVINGVAVMEGLLLAGDYTVVATYMGDDRFNTNITSESFTVRGHVKKNTTISADANVDGNRVTISVSVDENATGYIGLKQSESIIYIELEDGMATYIADFAQGSYNFEVTYTGDDNFNENSTELMFTVVEAAKENTTIALDVSSIENNVTFTVNVSPNATGIVRFDVSGAEEYVVYADVINGVAVMAYVLSVGDYNVVATYMGDERFNSNAISESFTVKGHVKKDTPISADADVNGYKVTISVNVDGNATGFVNMKFAETVFNVELSDGTGFFAIDLPANSYSVDVTYLGDYNFNQNSTGLSFTVEDPVKENTPISLDINTIENNATFTVSVDSDATGIVRFEVSGAEAYTVYADVIDGKAVMENVLLAGDYTAIATYMGDERFNSNITSESFTVKGHIKKNTPISADADVNGNNVAITVNVDSNATGFVGLKMLGSVIYIALDDGAATYSTALPAGSYNVDVTYVGDDDFNGNSTILLFTVVEAIKENTPISLDVSTVEDYATFTVNVDSEASGIVKFEVSGAEEYVVYGDVINGVAVMKDVLSVGDYTVIATYMGNVRFNSNATSESFTVKGHVKKDTPISADADVNAYKVTISVNVDGNATGFVNMKFADTEYNVALADGAGSLTVNLPASSYSVDVTYLGDYNFNQNSTILSFTVEDPVKENTPISLDVNTLENNATFTVNVNSDATGIVRFDISGVKEYVVYADVINGVAVIENVLEVGDYTVVATYMGDDRFNSNITSESFTIIGHVKKDTPISADADVNGNRVTITVNVDSDATGFVGLKLSGSTIYIQLENGVATFVYTFAVGSYNVDVTYAGDDNFNENSTRLMFTVVEVAKENTTIALDVSSVENNATFTVSVNSDATGIVKFDVSGAEEYVVYADVINGVAVMADVLSVGDYTVVATYMGDERFNSNVTSGGFTIAGHVKKDTPIDAVADVNGYRVTITVNVDSNATGFVNVKFADAVFNVELSDGSGSFAIDLPAKSYNVEVIYLGDYNFNQNSTGLSFTIEDPVKENTPISLDVNSIENNATFTVNVNSDATGIVRFEVSGAESYTVYADVIDGKAIMVDVLSVGDYTVVATYLGDSRFNSNITSESFTIAGHVKKDTSISADAKVNGNRVTITVNVDSDATGFVGLKLSGSTIYIQLENGVATYVNTFVAGSYNVEVTYDGDDDFNENSTRLMFTVVEVAKENTTIALDVSSVENNAIFTVGVDSDATGIVRFEVSGAEEYVVYADVIDGRAIMNDVLSVGDYTVVATYMGDGRFNTNTTSESFTIKGHVKKDTPISANVSMNGNRVTIDVGVDENATGFVKIKLADIEFNVALTDGAGSLTVNLPADSYSVDVTYLGDDNFNENMTRLSFTVSDPVKENTPISLAVLSAENNATFTVNVNSDATGIVRFEVSGAEEYVVYTDVINGVAVIENVFEVGDYAVVATYLGDSRFNSNITSESFTIKGHVKKDTPISADAKVSGNRVTITVNVDENATGFVGLKLLGSTIYVPVENGMASYVNTFVAGSYNVEVTYTGDDNFNENSTRMLFTVVEAAKENTTIALDVSSVENNATFTVSLNSDATGIVRFEVSGAEEYTVYADVIDGKAVMKDVLSVGDYTVVATYMGDSRFNSNTTSGSFTIKGHVKKDTPISADVKVSGNRVTLTVNVDSNATGFVNIKFTDNEFNVALTDGAGSLTVNLPASSYCVDVAYLGDDNFNENMTKLSFTVLDPVKENTTISLAVSSIENNATFTVNLNSDVTGIVRFEVSGAEEYTVYADVIDGKAVIEDVLSVGDYTVVATYLGDSRFNSNITSESFSIKGHIKKDTSISADAKVSGNRVTITVGVDSDATGFVGLKLVGSTIYVPVKDGVASYVNTFATGSYNVEVTYIGDDDFNENSTRVLFTVVEAAKDNTDVILNVSSVENNATFTVDVSPDATGIVKFEVSGAEVYTVYADVVDGRAVMKDVLSAGEYTVVATYLGDSKFNSNSTTASFTILNHVKIDTPIKAVPTVDGNTVTITATVDSNATGFVTFEVLGQRFMIPVNDGKAVFTFDFAPNTYTANVVYLGDDNFNNASTTATFTVIKQDVELKNTTLDVNVDSIENNVNIIAYVNASASGLVEFVIDGRAVYIAVNNGEAAYNLVLPGGDYNVSVTYMGDDKFNPNATTKSFTVLDHVKADTIIKAQVTVNGSEVSVTAEVNETAATGFVEFSIAGREYYIPLNEGKAVFVADFTPGIYMGNVQYLGDENFNGAITLVYIYVAEKNATLDDTAIDVDVDVYDSNVTITASVNSNATGFVKFDVSGAENYTLYVLVEDGKAIFKDVLTVGDYLVTATYLGDDKFNMNSTSESFTISGHVKKDTEINAVPNVDGSTVTITASVDSNATGYITIGVLGQTFIVPVKDGKAVFTYDFTPRTYTANVVYLGDDDFNNASTSVSFTVIKQDVELKNTTLSAEVSAVENNVTITAEIDSLASGLVEFNIDGKAVYIAVNNGEAVYSINLPAGEYNVAVTYLGDDKFNPNSTTKAFTVTDHVKKNTPISADASVSGNVVTIDVNVDSNASGFVEFNIDGDVVYVAVNGGKAVYSVVLPDGNYSASIKYMGDKDFNVNSTAVDFAVSTSVVKVTEFTDVTVSGDYVITARLVDSNGNAISGATVKYAIDDVVSSTKTDANGAFTINAKNNCVVFIEFAGNSTLVATNISIKLDEIASKKLASQFNVSEGVSIKTYAVDRAAGEIGKTELFLLTDSNGNPIANASVQFAYKTVILNRTTDEKGIVFIGINTQIAQEALCAMSYLGDDKYNATFVAFNFNIQKKPITISASAKTYKVSAKTKKYTVTIKTQKCNSRDGKVYLKSGKKITMKINGKTYTAKTNAKGQATFSLKITKRGKFAASIKFAGDVTYASASKSVKITIK